MCFSRRSVNDVLLDSFSAYMRAQHYRTSYTIHTIQTSLPKRPPYYTFEYLRNACKLRPAVRLCNDLDNSLRKPRLFEALNALVFLIDFPIQVRSNALFNFQRCIAGPQALQPARAARSEYWTTSRDSPFSLCYILPKE